MAENEDPKGEAESPAPEPEIAAAVVILKQTDAEGAISVVVTHQGDVRPTEYETLLKMGLQRWQRQIGV
jgi:hypothetical protein